MQNTKLIHKVLKYLEIFILKKNGFNLTGPHDYDLILFVPSDSLTTDCHFSLMLSAASFDNAAQRHVAQELLHYLKVSLTPEDYACLSRINIIHSQDPFVKKIREAFTPRLETVEINKFNLGDGIGINRAFLVKSLILDKFIPKNIITLEVKDQGNGISMIEASIVRIEKDLAVIYYTDKGIREICKPSAINIENGHVQALRDKSERYLIENRYMSRIGWANIVSAL